ncbi:hypothetical protein [Mesorhizobium australicum]|uniref:Uncharacterized protein n=1 Tax=Mesorhizobium australicum TaxID=536018 RepID=A0A1X7NYZ7_9HYPH|nr:hypothetical protein [Mesorhizobium australicum]SMH42601.1 hypothetical protein SAMN02982922_2766 [Mesorhizobium australicum]
MTVEAGEDSDRRSGWVTFGFIATALYALLLAVSIWSPWTGWGWSAWVTRGQALSLNEFGDLLAGAFAPLAFLWLMVAVMVQSQELRLQKKELELTRQVAVETRAEIAVQASAAKANADYVGQQTEILTKQLEREQRRAASDQFAILVQLTATVLRTRLANEVHFFKDGHPGWHLVRSEWFIGDDYRDLVAASRQMRRVKEKHKLELEAGTLVLRTPFTRRRLLQLIDLLDAMSSLSVTAYHMSPFMDAIEVADWRQDLQWLADLPGTA